MSLGIAHAVWTLALLGAFVGVVGWVWSGRRRSHFEEAGRIPFHESGPDAERPEGRGR
jgi:cytochrome c oxidase cbb3-type subunit 4